MNKNATSAISALVFCTAIAVDFTIKRYKCYLAVYDFTKRVLPHKFIFFKKKTHICTMVTAAPKRDTIPTNSAAASVLAACSSPTRETPERTAPDRVSMSPIRRFLPA